jgi:photosystem II stability/assembly factor-like uncharacterized protein
MTDTSGFRSDFYQVFGVAADRVWMVGETGQVKFWDGELECLPFCSQTVPTTKNLRRVFMQTQSRGYIVGDEGVFLTTSDGGVFWRNANVANYTDDWKAIGLVDGPGGTRGWALGSGRGTRVFYNGTTWDPPAPDDRNSGHVYSDVAMMSISSAFASRSDASGARMMIWDGSAWSPGPATGTLYDMHVLSPTQGVAVGTRGSVWRLGDDGRWAQMPTRPQTSGQDLFGVHMVSDDLIWVGGARTELQQWDGTRWTKVTVPGTQVRAIRSIWIAPDGSEGWAVGDDGLVLRYK